MGRRSLVRKTQSSKETHEQAPKINRAEQSPTKKTVTGEQRSFNKRIGAIMLGLTAIAGITTHYFTKENDAQQTPSVGAPNSSGNNVESKEATTQKLIERTWTLINNVEGGLDIFKTKYLPKIEKYANNEKSRLVINQLINFIEQNKENPDRNYPEMRKKGVDTLKTSQFTYLIQEATNGNIPSNSYSMAAFSPDRRSIEISEKFNPENIIDWLAVIHEMTHVADDSAFQNAYLDGKFPDYQLQRNSGGININSEVKAFTYQVELLDALTENYISQQINAGENILEERHVKKIVTILGLENFQNRKHMVALKNLLFLTEKYFANGGMTEGRKVPEEFYKTVYGFYKWAKLYVLVGNKLVEINEQNYLDYATDGSKIF